MAFFIAGLALRNLPMECAAVFLISTEGAVFGPSKYGLLPELLPEPRLSWGNGIIEFGTFLSGIAGTIAAGNACRPLSRPRRPSPASCFWRARFVGLLTSLGISRVPAANPVTAVSLESAWRFWRAAEAYSQRPRARLGRPWQRLSLFSCSSFATSDRDLWPRRAALDERHTSYLQAAIAIGIGLGSVAAGYLSGGKIEYGLIPLGAVGMTVFGALLYFPATFARDNRASASGAAGIFRRPVRRARQRADSASAPSGTERRRDRRGESDFVDRHRDFVGRVLPVRERASPIAARPFSSMARSLR